MKINLADYTDSNLTCLVGREIGSKLRPLIGNDSVENYTLIIPDNIITITHSFFLAMFGEELKKLGSTNFLKKYHFSASDHIKNKISLYSSFLFYSSRIN